MKQKTELQENSISSFFYYMWNAWREEECRTVFGWEHDHFWSKWIHHAKETPSGTAEKFYADLSTGSRVKLVKRACEVYDGNKRKEGEPLKITEETGDTVEIYLSPDKYPVAYQRKKYELMNSCGMSEEEAERNIFQTPFVLELFYAIDRGLFAVESEPLDCIEIYNPYTGEEIPNENISN